MWQLALVSLLWALSFGLVAQLKGLDPAFVAALRTLLAALVFLPFLRARGLGARRALGLMAVGGLQFGLMYVAYIQSYRWLGPAEVALFTIFTPLYVALLGRGLPAPGDGRGPSAWSLLLAAGLAVAGTGVCLWTALRPGLLAGFLAMQASNGAFALGQLLYRRMAPRTGRSDLELMALLYGGAALVTAVLALPALASGAWCRVTPGQGTILLYLGVVASGIGFFLFNAGARRVDVGTLAIFNNAKVPLGVLASALVFGASVDWLRLLLGGGAIAGALALHAAAVRRTS